MFVWNILDLTSFSIKMYNLILKKLIFSQNLVHSFNLHDRNLYPFFIDTLLYRSVARPFKLTILKKYDLKQILSLVFPF